MALSEASGRKQIPAIHISDIVGRIDNIPEAAIIREGGKKIGKDGLIIYVFRVGKVIEVI